MLFIFKKRGTPTTSLVFLLGLEGYDAVAHEIAGHREASPLLVGGYGYRVFWLAFLSL